MDLITKAKYNLSKLDASGKLIVWIVVGSLLAWIFRLIYVPAYEQFILPSILRTSIIQPWSFITYGFVHSGFFHLLFNMLGLYIAGRGILNVLGKHVFLGIFFLGVVAGGIGFSIATYFAFTYFNAASLVGASAGVYATIFFLAFYLPFTSIRLAFWNIKLEYICYALLVFDLFAILGKVNAGGSIAHLMGAGLGFYAAKQLHASRDITSFLVPVFDFFSDYSFRSNRKPKQQKTNLKAVYKAPLVSRKTSFSKSENQQQIDAVLDKISLSGYDSLTKAEKEVLFKAGKE